MEPEDVRPYLRGLGFSERDATVLSDHFLDAERRGKVGHGLIRVEWLSTLIPERSPDARPERVVAGPCFERWESRGAFGYLVMAAICDAQLADPPERARLVVAADSYPTGVLGYWVRRLAEGGLVGVMTSSSPRRLTHPDGGAPLTGTNPLAFGIPSSDGRPIVADVSTARWSHGDVLAGRAGSDEHLPFGGDQVHKGFALALGLQLLVDSLVGPDAYGAVLLVARPEADPVPALRELAAGLRLPGDS